MPELFHRFYRVARPRLTIALAAAALVGSWSLDVAITRAAQGDCGQPASTGSAPTASDALFVLRTAVGLESCDVCICDVDSSGNTAASDALAVLGTAVGGDVTLMCTSCAAAPPLYAVATFPAGVGTLYRIDNYASAPSAFIIGGTALFLAGDIAIDPTSGRGYAVMTTGELAEIDLGTGEILATMAAAGANPNALTFSDDGTLYSWGGRPQVPFMDTNLYELDKQNGGGQPVLDTGFLASGDLAYDAATGFLYGSSSTGELIRIDLDQDTVVSVGTMTGAPGGVLFLGLEIDPVDGTMYALGSGTLSTFTELYTVDKSTAAVTPVDKIDGAHTVLGGWGLAFGPPS